MPYTTAKTIRIANKDAVMGTKALTMMSRVLDAVPGDSVDAGLLEVQSDVLKVSGVLELLRAGTDEVAVDNPEDVEFLGVSEVKVVS